MGGSQEEVAEFRPMSFSTSSMPSSALSSAVASPLGGGGGGGGGNPSVSLATTTAGAGGGGGGRVCVQQPMMKVSQMTIHNITMMQDRQHLIVASDTQTQLGGRHSIGGVGGLGGAAANNNNGAMFGKISKGRSAPKPQQVTVQQGHVLGKPVAAVAAAGSASAGGNMVQIVAAPQFVAACNSAAGGPLTPTFATAAAAKPFSTPIPIASKPVSAALQSVVSGGKGGRAASMSSLGMQPAAILPGPQAASMGTIVLQPGSQYGSMTLLNASGLSAAAAAVQQGPKVQAGNASVHTTVNSQGFMTTLRNIAPPQHSSQAQKVGCGVGVGVGWGGGWMICVCFSVCVSLSVCFCLSLSFLSVCLSVSLSFPSFCLCLSVSLLPICLFLSVSLSLLPVCLFLSVSLSVSLSLLPVCFSLSLSVSHSCLFLSVSPSCLSLFFLSVSLSCLYLSFLSVYSLSVCLSPSCLSLSFLSVCLSHSCLSLLPVCVSLSVV